MRFQAILRMTIEPYDASVFQKINLKTLVKTLVINDEESLYSKPSDYFLCCEIVELVFYSQFVQCILLINVHKPNAAR